jgi:hypothetical protein
MTTVKTLEYIESFEFWRTELNTTDSLNTLNLKGYWEVVWKDLEGNEIKREKNLDNPLQFNISDISDPAVLQGFLTVTNFMKDKLDIHLNPPEPEPEPVEEPPAE